MTRRSNLHTHTIYCDGIDTPRELVEAAIELGFDTLGFSGHSYMAWGEGWCMSRESAELYRAEIQRLKREYAGRLNILCGIEQDYYSDTPADGYDYVIGSVHGVLRDGEYLSVDESYEAFCRNVAGHYGGDAYAFIEDYYELVSGVVEKTNADIIGHIDLVTKFNRGGELFDRRHPRYIAASRAAALALVKTGKPFEINTGAMARGLADTPYPAAELMRFIYESGGDFIVTSDCHDKRRLDFGFDVAYALYDEL